jgi:hypothetical protein
MKRKDARRACVSNSIGTTQSVLSVAAQVTAWAPELTPVVVDHFTVFALGSTIRGPEQITLTTHVLLGGNCL